MILHTSLYYRPLIYFIILSILSGLIVLDIITTNKPNVLWIAFKILLISLNIRYGLFFEFNGLSGGDIWTHGQMISNIIELGVVNEETMEGSRYYLFPIFHLLISVPSILLNITLKSSIFISIIVPFILSSLILYKIGESIGGDKVGLLALLLYQISDIPILKTSLHIEPLTLVSIFFCLIFWLLFRERKNKFSLLILSIFTVIIISHQLSALASLFLISLIIIAYYLNKSILSLFNSNIKIELNKLFLLLIMGIILVLYWNYTLIDLKSNMSIFEFMIQPFIKIIKYGIGGNIESLSYIQVLSSYDIISNLLFQLGYFILLFLHL